tara:strand:+ start:1142 stop:1879 length:738 start_codon:yes stop_codon:yes gene_type:complete
MKYKLLISFFLIASCANSNLIKNSNLPYTSKGFAYIYNEKDFEAKIIKGRLNNNEFQIAHKNLKVNSLIKIINPKTNDYVVLKNQKRIDYPDFYKVLISEQVAKKLKINNNLPFVEILEIKKNKSFVAKKAKIFTEEKKISSNAPVASVQISNISKDKDLLKNKAKDEFSILIGTFYSKKVAEFLKERINKEIPNFDIKKLKIVKKSNKESDLISGPYKTINFMKNDYIQLKKFGFEELDIIIND